MPIAVSLDETRRYVLKCDRDLPPDEQTVFIIGTLTSAQAARINDRILQIDTDQGSAVQPQMGTAFRLACAYGVHDWENFRDAKGNDVRPRRIGSGSRRMLSDESLDRIRPWMAELFGAVMEHNDLGSVDEGNSSSSPPSPPAEARSGSSSAATGGASESAAGSNSAALSVAGHQLSQAATPAPAAAGEVISPST